MKRGEPVTLTLSAAQEQFLWRLLQGTRDATDDASTYRLCKAILKRLGRDPRR
jgi:hypothetical protein